MRNKMKVLSILMVAVLMASCNMKGNNAKENQKTEDAKEVKKAVAVLSSASGSSVNGEATFTKVENGVKMLVTVDAISPGPHAIHLHEKGDCSAPDATSAGGHWNPTGEMHGKPGEGDHHAGDIDNIIAKKDSTAQFEIVMENWTIGDGSKSDILGKSVIIHAGPDDFESQPSGAAGARIACGVIKEM